MRLIGPIRKDGALVTAVWIGDPSDPEGGKDHDLTLATSVTVISAFLVVALGAGIIGMVLSN